MKFNDVSGRKKSERRKGGNRRGTKLPTKKRGDKKQKGRGDVSW